MKKSVLIVVTLICLLVLSACGCKHEWIEANCLTPKTCNLCQETEGDALGHAWVEATCETAKTCSYCGVTEGEALGHIWIDATTEAPKTCQTCNTTEGQRIITDPRFTTTACSDFFGSWKGQLTVPAEALGFEGVDEVIVYDCVFTFCNTGEVYQSTAFADWDAVKHLFRDFFESQLYSQFSAMGMDQAAAEAVIEQSYGMTMDEYIDDYMSNLDPNSTMEEVSMVYYVDGSNVYMGYSWYDEMQVNMYTLEGDTLILITLPQLDKIELTRVTE